MKKSLLLIVLCLLFIFSCEQPTDSTPEYVGTWYSEDSTTWSLVTFTENTFSSENGSLGSSASSRMKGSISISGNILTINPEYSYNFTSSTWVATSTGSDSLSYVRDSNNLILTRLLDSTTRTYSKQ